MLADFVFAAALLLGSKGFVVSIDIGVGGAVKLAV